MKLTILAALVSVLVGGADALHAQEVENLHTDEVKNPCILNCPDGAVFAEDVYRGFSDIELWATCQETIDTAKLVEPGSDSCQSLHDLFGKYCCIAIPDGVAVPHGKYVQFEDPSGDVVTMRRSDFVAELIGRIIGKLLFWVFFFVAIKKLLVWGGCLTGSSSSSRRSVGGGGGPPRPRASSAVAAATGPSQLREKGGEEGEMVFPTFV